VNDEQRAAARTAFEKASKDLPWTSALGGRVLWIEPLADNYWRSNDIRRRCIVEIGGVRYLAYYD
jgi:hypothetical protein